MTPVTSLRRSLVYVVCFSALVLCTGPLGHEDGGHTDLFSLELIALESDSRHTPTMTSDEMQRIVSEAVKRKSHFLADFKESQDEVTRSLLDEDGFELVSHVDDGMYLARATKNLSIDAVAHSGMRWVGPVSTWEKLSPRVVDFGLGTGPCAHEDQVKAAVYFHDDVVPEEARLVFSQLGLRERGAVRALNVLTAAVSREDISRLSMRDEIEFIDQLAPPFRVMNDGVRGAIGVDSLQGAPYNLSGDGVTVLVYDRGWVEGSHPDFGDRVTLGDFESPHSPDEHDDHATHVGGTIAGDGTLSSGQYRGMAPAAELVSFRYPECYAFPDTPWCLYDEPQDIEADYQSAIDTYGAQFANNSIGADIEKNEYGCDFQGDYETTSDLLDVIACGDWEVGIPFLSIWAAGDERTYNPEGLPIFGCYGFNTIGVPGGAKNTISVGATIAGADSLAPWSPWGPTDDGRIKPDVCAPGAHAESSGVWSTDKDHNIGTNYSSYGNCAIVGGTSAATAAVSGCVALLYEKYWKLFPERSYPDDLPLPSTIKAILVNSARDLGNTGPDYKHGFGEIDAEEAVNQLVNLTWGVGEVAQGETDHISFYVPLDQGKLRITVAWDDPHKNLGHFYRLLNTLAVWAEDASNWPEPGGDEYHAWHLDPAHPDYMAIQELWVDDPNNVQQVEVDIGPGMSGVWTLAIWGVEVWESESPQVYSYAINVDNEVESVYADVVSPNGGEVWAVGTEHTITWNVEYPRLDIDHFEVSYSYDGGDDRLIAICDASEREVEWSVPGFLSSEYVVKVTAHLTDETTRSDVSDEYFTVYRPRTAWYPPNGVAIFTDEAYAYSYSITTDGSSGAIIAWSDGRGSDTQIYAQRVETDGTVLWTEDGITVCGEVNDQGDPRICPSGLGSSIIVWSDKRSGNYDLYAQKVDSAGSAQWSAGGVAVCDQAGSQHCHSVIPDGFGGAITAWLDQRAGGFAIYTQRLDSDGDCLWADDGVIVSGTMEYYVSPLLVSDGSGGAIVVWNDDEYQGIYAQRVDSSGVITWTPGDVTVCPSDYWVVSHAVAADGVGGAIVVWEDDRNEVWPLSNHDVFAQRIDSEGMAKWATGGAAVCTDSSVQAYPKVASDGDGGAFIVWSDGRNGDSWMDLYAQRIDSAGSAYWATDGIGFCLGRYSSEGISHDMISDGSGGVIVAWSDSCGGDLEVFSQRIDATGGSQWLENGEIISAETGDQYYPVLTSDGLGGAIYAWRDNRGNWGDIYAQKIEGDLPAPAPGCDIVSVVVEDTSGTSYTLDEKFLFGCPAGDGGYALVCSLDFHDADLAGIARIEPEEISIDTDEVPFAFWGDNTADSAATYENGYTTTVTRRFISVDMPCAKAGCDECPDFAVPVCYKGAVVCDIKGTTRGLITKSTDYTGDEKVGLADLGYFGFSYNRRKGDPGYNCSFDFDGNEFVNICDMGVLGTHYQHEYEPGGGLLSPGPHRMADVGVRFDIRGSGDGARDGRIAATICLEKLRGISTLAMVLRADDPALKFEGWRPNPDFPAVPVVTEGRGNHSKELLLVLFRMECAEGTEYEAGTLEFSVRDDSAVPLEDGISMLFGEVLDSEGIVRTIGDVEYEATPPVRVNFLARNYPNPCNPATTIEYSISRDSHVNLSVYNVRGQLVRTLLDGFQRSNRYSIAWDGTDNQGRSVASGVYFCRINTEDFRQSRKMVLVR
jgi:hypothetical protein